MANTNMRTRAERNVKLFRLFLIVSVWHYTRADYACLCNYAVETVVHATPKPNGAALGYLYEFDCKAIADPSMWRNNYFAIQFEHQVGYVEPNGQNTANTICEGDVSPDDLVTTTPAATHSHTSHVKTDATTAATTISTQPTTMTLSTTMPTTTTISTTTMLPTTTTSTTTTVPTTTSTTPQLSTASISRSTTTTTNLLTTVTIPHANTASSIWLEAAVNGTSLMYVGVGYDVISGTPLARTDRGFHLARRVFQLTPSSSSSSGVQEINTISNNGYMAGPKSSNPINSAKSAQSLELRYFNFTGSNPVTGDNFLQNAFILDPELQQKISDLRNDINLVYRDDITFWLSGNTRYMTELAESQKFHITKDFATDVCKLPKTFNSSQYLAFLEQWGTHVSTSVDMGYLHRYQYQTSISELLSKTQQVNGQLILHTGKFERYDASLTLNRTAYQYDPTVINRAAFGTFWQHLTKGASGTDVPIYTELVPISDALNYTYWRSVLDMLVGSGVCSDDVDDTYLQTVQQNLIQALQQYPGYMKKNGTYSEATDDRPLQIPVTWPYGTYTLMQTTGGCPRAGVMWAEGSRFQDTEDPRGSNDFTSEISSYLRGVFQSNGIELHYCTKTTEASSRYHLNWPAGSYCIMKKGTCPTGFGEGNIFWDDDDTANSNSDSGILPDGVYDTNTKINYCCRSDGTSREEIILPTDRPFVLHRYQGSCQSVWGTTMKELRIKWDDEDLFNKDSALGYHPLDDGNSHEHILHFCFYSPNIYGSVPIIG